MSSQGAARQNIAGRAIRALAAQSVGQYGALVFGVIKGMLLARLVSNETFGYVFLATSYVSFLSFFKMQVREAITRDTDASDARLLALFGIELITLAPGLLIAVLGYLLAGPQLAPEVWVAIAVILGSRVVTAAGSVPTYLLERDLRQRDMAALLLGGTILSLLIVVPLAYVGFPLLALLIDAVLPPAVTALGAWPLARWRPRGGWDREAFRDGLRFGAAMWIGGLFGKISFEFDDWLVGTLRGPGALGYYGKAYSLAKLPLDVIAGVIASVSLGLYGQSRAAGRDVLVSAYRQLTWLLSRVIFLSSAVMLAAAEEMVLILYGPGWLPVAPLVRLMAIYALVRPFWQNDAILIVTMGGEKLHRSLAGLQALILLLIGPPAVYWFGGQGASVAVSVMMLVGAVTTGWAAAKRLEINPLPIYLTPLLIFLLVTPLIYGLGLIAPLPAVPSFILKGLAGTLLFGGLSWLTERRQLLDAVALLRQHLSPQQVEGPTADS